MLKRDSGCCTAFVLFFIMKTVNGSVLGCPGRARPFSGFPGGKPAAPLPFPPATRTPTDLFLPTFAVILKPFLTSSIPVSKSSCFSTGAGSGGLSLPNHVSAPASLPWTSLFLFRSHSSLCGVMSASTFSCSSLLLRAVVCTAPSPVRGTFRPGHRRPLHPSPVP